MQGLILGIPLTWPSRCRCSQLTTASFCEAAFTQLPEHTAGSPPESRKRTLQNLLFLPTSKTWYASGSILDFFPL